MTASVERWWDDDDALTVALVAVGATLDVSALAGAPTLARSARPVRRWLAAASILLVIAASVVLAVEPARRTVSGWLHVGNIEVHIDRASTSSAPGSARPLVFGAGADSIEPAAVAAELDAATLHEIASSSLGPPARWWSIPEGGVVAEWPTSATTLWVASVSDDFGSVILDKLVGSGESVTELADLGGPPGGVAIAGDHLLVTPHRTIAAASVVAWTERGRMFRLESTDVPLDELIGVAYTLAG